MSAFSPSDWHQTRERARRRIRARDRLRLEIGHDLLRAFSAGHPAWSAFCTAVELETGDRPEALAEWRELATVFPPPGETAPPYGVYRSAFALALRTNRPPEELLGQLQKLRVDVEIDDGPDGP